MRKLLWLLLVFASFIPIESEAGGYPSLRFALYMSPSSVSYQEVFLPFAENVKRDSNGELNISLYPSGVLGRNPAEQINLVQHGHADIAVVIPFLATELFPGTEVTRIPGLIHNATEGSIAIWRTYDSMKLLQSRSLRILSIFVASPDIIHAKKNINSFDALKGLKLRSNTDNEGRLISELGAKPIQLPASEAYTALQMGVVDGAVMNWDLAGRLKLNEIMKYHYNLPLGSTMVALVMNERRYRQLSNKARDAIDRNSGEKLAKIWGEVYDHQNLMAKEKIKKNGGNVTEPRHEDKIQLEKKTLLWLKKLDGISSELGNEFSKKIRVVRKEMKP
jgi:TRAP-type C4-dicarboxylate transport system substrate-binding protein